MDRSSDKSYGVGVQATKTLAEEDFFLHWQAGDIPVGRLCASVPLMWKAAQIPTQEGNVYQSGNILGTQGRG